MSRAWISTVFLLACGGTVSAVSVPASTDAGDADKSLDAGDADKSLDAGDADKPLDAAADAGACVASPQIGDPCTEGQTSCDRVDPCCAETAMCDGATHTWKDLGVACLICTGVPCGDQTCAGGSVCVTHASGVSTPDGGTSTSDTCAPMPAACSRDWTCGCVTKHLPAGCTLPASGGCDDHSMHVTLACMGI